MATVWGGIKLLLGILLFSVFVEAKVVQRAIEYEHKGVVLEGFLAYDDSFSGPRPGVLVIHGQAGLGQFAKNKINELASLGYVAFAADLFGKGVRPKSPEEALRLSGSYKKDRLSLRERAMAGLDVLRKQQVVDSSRLAAAGYCFGGVAALELARGGAPLRSVVSFHSELDSPNPGRPNALKASVLVLHGAEDSRVSEKDLLSFEREMRSAGADWQLIKYANSVNSFTNPMAGSDPTKGFAYNEKADRRSWAAMKDFFRETLGK